MAYVLSNGSVLAQTAYTDAGLTIGTGTTALGNGRMAGVYVTGTAPNSTQSATPNVIYAFPNQTNTEGLYFMQLRATNEDPAVSVLPNVWTGMVLKVTPNTTFSNVIFALWTSSGMSVTRGTTNVTNDTISFTHSAADGDRSYQFSMIKVI